MPTLLLLGLIFHAFPFSARPYPPNSLPHSFPTSSLSHFTRLSPFPRRRTRNLAIADRMRSAYILYLSVRKSRLAGRYMFSTCPYIRPFVCPSVRLLPTCERYTTKTNEPISTKIGLNLSRGQWHERSTSEVRSKVKVTED